MARIVNDVICDNNLDRVPQAHAGPSLCSSKKRLSRGQ